MREQRRTVRQKAAALGCRRSRGRDRMAGARLCLAFEEGPLHHPAEDHRDRSAERSSGGSGSRRTVRAEREEDAPQPWPCRRSGENRPENRREARLQDEADYAVARRRDRHEDEENANARQNPHHLAGIWAEKRLPLEFRGAGEREVCSEAGRRAPTPPEGRAPASPRSRPWRAPCCFSVSPATGGCCGSCRRRRCGSPDVELSFCFRASAGAGAPEFRMQLKATPVAGAGFVVRYSAPRVRNPAAGREQNAHRLVRFFRRAPLLDERRPPHYPSLHRPRKGDQPGRRLLWGLNFSGCLQRRHYVSRVPHGLAPRISGARYRAAAVQRNGAALLGPGKAVLRTHGAPTAGTDAGFGSVVESEFD
mmetsp:Transcript_16431/g.40626  ORF Transcript_16431/g.40626 Transcript_16431/m.40626 type:complete len:364 (-) Transcript_16431:1949-3040(-)